MTTVTAAVLVAGFAILALRQLGWIPDPPSAAFWRERAETAEQALKAVTEERDDLVATRTLEPILQMLGPTLELLKHVSETQQATMTMQQQTLEKLAQFNGSLGHVEDGLRDATDGMKVMTGLIAELHGLPVHPPRKEDA